MIGHTLFAISRSFPSIRLCSGEGTPPAGLLRWLVMTRKHQTAGLTPLSVLAKALIAVDAQLAALVYVYNEIFPSKANHVQ